jgi:nitroimidazol reductase NimA-like FMN-containing flavoprotein (pyridoxamine 5'-phosphate oxidase superfamily)
MGDLRGVEQRKADVLRAMDSNHDVWLATAEDAGRPHLIAVSCWWDGSRLTIATTKGSRTARKLAFTGL